MEKNVVLGVDIGGSHITAMLIELKTGNPIRTSKVRRPLNPKESAITIIKLWTDVIRRAFDYEVIATKKIGIAMPGPFDYNAGIAWMKDQNKYDSLYGLNVKELLAEHLEITPENIRFLNDAESFLKGEVFKGNARNNLKAIGLTLGTGLGSARYKNGHVEDADLWNCPFLEGIAEDYLSTRWFVSKFYSFTGIKIKGVKELAAIAVKNSAARETFREFGYNLSLFLMQVVENDEPETIVIGGNIAKAFPFFKEELHKQLKNLPNKPSIKKAKLGEESSLIGAASCWVRLEKQLVDKFP